MDIRKVVSLSIIPIILCSAILIYIYNEQFPIVKSPDSGSAVIKCDNDGKVTGVSLGASNNLVLRKLAEYEAVCAGAVVDELMVFTSMPQTLPEASRFAKDTANILKEFRDHNIPPLVLFEPSLASQINLADIKNGIYDVALRSYFQTLKTLGVSSREMGTWVLFPEANTPTWHTTDPADFVANVKKVGSIQKDVFPTSKISLLLNSRTYPSHDTDWSHGELKSLAGYVSGIPAGLVDRFGYQGFPSVSEANALHPYSQLEAHDFLPINLATEAARAINVSSVWLNTGTFDRMYVGQPEAEVRINSTERREILESILQQAKELKAQRFNVSVNLFAEDKSLANEHVDWSYWSQGQASQSPDTQNFKWFVHGIRANDIQFSLYDHLSNR